MAAVRTVVVYESMYGNTRTIAEAIADGLGPADVAVVPVADAAADIVTGADLLIVGGPTHAFGMSRPQTRQAAADAAGKPENGVTLEPEARGTGIREWLTSLGSFDGTAAVFDTRVKMPGPTGHASRGIRKLLRQRGHQLIARPQSFFVTKDNTLRPGETDRARQWGEQLAALLTERAR